MLSIARLEVILESDGISSVVNTNGILIDLLAVSYTHLTLPTNREV